MKFPESVSSALIGMHHLGKSSILHKSNRGIEVNKLSQGLLYSIDSYKAGLDLRSLAGKRYNCCAMSNG